MRTLKACALSLALIPTLAFAASDKINCREFAAEQLKEIKQEYYGALTRDESALALDVAERSCRSLFETVEEERAAIQATPTEGFSSKDKEHWWEENRGESGGTLTIKKAHQKGGK